MTPRNALDRTAGLRSRTAAVHRGHMYRLIVCAATTLFIFAGCESNTADARLRRHLGIASKGTLTETEVRNAALRLMPPGSEEEEVRVAVARTGIGQDGLSTYYPPGQDRRGVIVVGFDPKTFGLVKRSYALVLQFDSRRKLEDIQVQARLTGP